MRISNIGTVVGLFAFGSLLVAGCGSDPTPVSCNDLTQGEKGCATYSAAEGADVSQDQLDAACGGKVVDACPTDGLVGTCEIMIEKSIVTVAYFYDGTAASDETVCKAEKGDWTTK